MSDGKVSSILLFLASYPFTKKLNAIGISSLPAALKAYQGTKKEELKKDVKQKMYLYAVGLFHSSAVFSGLFGKYPMLIQAHAIVGIGTAVKDSIAVRKEEEEKARLEAEKRAQQSENSISRTLKNWIFGSSSSSIEDKEDDEEEEENVQVSRAVSSVSATEESEKVSSAVRAVATQEDVNTETAKSKGQKLTFRKKLFSRSKSKPSPKKEQAADLSIVSSASTTVSTPESTSTVSTSLSTSVKEKKPKGYKTAKAQKAVKRTKSILKGKRDSSTDDIIWGVFQTSFVLLDQTIGKALAYAWLLFLLTVLEEALLNPKLDKKQRLKRFCWIFATGYYSGKLVMPDWNAITGDNTVGEGSEVVY